MINIYYQIHTDGFMEIYNFSDTFFVICYACLFGYVVKCLDMYLDIFISADGAAILYPLDEHVPGPVVCESHTHHVLRLDDLNLLPVSLCMGEDKFIPPDLAAQKVAHVHLVGVQGAEQDI